MKQLGITVVLDLFSPTGFGHHNKIEVTMLIYISIYIYIYIRVYAHIHTHTCRSSSS